ncbi:MAG TPA: MFS transporter [Candidatus Saccharimonadia bacterium]|nr:MFS transporter [Candidatus Saccharimonadia bacterium]
MNNKEIRYNLTRYLFGALPARLGDEMSGQAILLMGLAATQTVFLGSTLLAGLTFSAALGGPLLGAILDRAQQPGRVLAGALGLYAGLIALIALSLGHVPVWASIVIALAAGFFMPAISGGWSSRLKSFVADEQMTRASAIDATTFNIAGLVGPALAGLVAAMLGAHWAIAVLVTLLVAALPMAWLLPKRPKSTKQSHNTSLWRDMSDGFKVIITNKALFRITLTSLISYMGIGMLWVICPLVGKEVFGNAGYGGVLMSVLSIGALVATVAYAKWPMRYSPDAVAFGATLALGIAMLVLAFAGNIIITLIAMLIAGLADGPQLAAIFAVRHREAPERSRSQVFTTGASLKITMAALGAVLAGQLAGISLLVMVLIAAFVQIMAAISFVLSSRSSAR